MVTRQLVGSFPHWWLHQKFKYEAKEFVGHQPESIRSVGWSGRTSWWITTSVVHPAGDASCGTRAHLHVASFMQWYCWGRLGHFHAVVLLGVTWAVALVSSEVLLLSAPRTLGGASASLQWYWVGQSHFPPNPHLTTHWAAKVVRSKKRIAPHIPPGRRCLEVVFIHMEELEESLLPASVLQPGRRGRLWSR